jgi:predicted metal-dependent phosphoesterase TrpH
VIELKADLHVHSTFSDGANTVEEILYMAKKRGLTHISFVDHDTVKGIPFALEIGKSVGVTVIPGIEISAFDFTRNRKVHILGYMFDEHAVNIQELCAPLLKRRHKNSIWQSQQLIDNGYGLSLHKLDEGCKRSRVLYKQHIMAAMMDLPYTDLDYQKLYKNIFKNDGICARDITYVDAIDAVQAIKADGGLAVLAHPGQMDSYEMIPKLVDAGLDGIELNHSDHTEEDKKKIMLYATKYNLALTGGSDFHGKFGADIEIGDIECPSSFIELLDKEKSAI